MKPDGVTMETTEPTDTAAVAEPSSLQNNITEQARSRQEEGEKDAAQRAAPKANGKSRTTEPKVKPKATVTKSQSSTKSGVSGSFSRPTTASHRTVNNVKSSNNISAAAEKKLTTTTAKASLSGAIPKRPILVAAVSTAAKSQTRMPDKKSVAPSRTTSVVAPTATNGTKPTSVNGTIMKRPATETVNVARSKTTATTSRTVASNSSKPSTSTTSKAVDATTSKTTRPATAPSASRPTTTKSRPMATTKPSTTATAKTTVSRVNTAPSTGRSTAAPSPRTTAKKDVSRPVSTTVTKKPTAATASAATKKPETSEPKATVKVNSAPKWSLSTKPADAKLSQTKPQQPARPAPTKKPVAVERFRANNKLPIGQTPAASSPNKPANGTASKTKCGTKPTQAVPPFTATKKANVSKATAQCATGTTTLAPTAAAVATTATLADARGEATVPLPLGSFHAASTSEDLSAPVLVQHTIPEVTRQETFQSREAAPTPQSPVRPTSSQTSPPEEQLESGASLINSQGQILFPVTPILPVASVPHHLLGSACLLMGQTPLTSTSLPTENAVLQVIPPTNLNEDEEEKEGSPLVSVSEMSGTTQPTEESRPGSAGLVESKGPLALQTEPPELDSEEVSGSQQGASELSAPGVLEGTESMDDLGDGSLKGAIDMEGASAGSPDFEKVPDIPVNDFDEDDDEDDNDDDRVCDMDVGSERADEPQRLRHDNDLDDDDDDVEMASEGVTESGLESYGNADEDDFAEDERLDNLNRLAQPPPPPPMLPSAPAAQWDQPNPFANPWAEPIDQGLHAIQGARAAVTSPLANPWQADSETPTQSPAQAWLELGSSPLVPENQEIPQYSSVKGEPLNLAVPMSIDQINPTPVQTLTSGTPGMSLSSTLSSETSTPEELGDYNREGNLQPQAPLEGAQPDLAVQLDRGEGEGEEEADTLPADEVLGGPATAPTSNPSSPSVTEDEASDTEGEAQLDYSLETPQVVNITFDSQPPTRRCLSTVEEVEEPEMTCTVRDDTTVLSATSYDFDTTITASNSNAQSTGESCSKSPGIFSLEELPEETKESDFIPPPSTHLAEQQYIECGKQKVETAEHGKEEVLGSEEAPIPSSTLCTLQQPVENTDAMQPPYYSAICKKTDDSFAGFATIPHPHRRDHPAYPRAYYDIVKAPGSAGAPPKLTCADLPPRNLGQQALSPQLRRLEQHQRQLLELQQRREQQHRPLEEAEQERKRREEEEQKKKKDEAEEEIKRNEQEDEREMEEEKLRSDEELRQRQDLELQLQQQQEELKQRQQIMQWQQELQQSNKGQTVLLSPSSGLCTIYEALENSDEEEAEEEGMNELNPVETKEKIKPQHDASYEELDTNCERLMSHEDQQQDSLLSDSPPPLPGSPQSSSNPSQDGDTSSPCPPDSPERPPPLELDWGKKVDIVQQLINQTLLLNRDGCSSLMLLPGGAGGTLSPLESSLWPSLLPPLTPPSATVTSVSSFSPEATGSSPQGEWTVVELETHH